MTSLPKVGPLTSVRSKRGADSFITSPLIKVLVGPESNRSELFIHQNIITARSKCFASALSGQWNSSETRTVNLYELDPDLTTTQVTHYLETVYTNKLATRGDDANYGYLCNVYIVAEQLLDVQTRNLALQAIYECVREFHADGKYHYPGHGCLRIIYDGTATALNHMRQFLVAIYLDMRGSQDLKVENVELFPKEFLMELAVAAMKERDFKAKPFDYDMSMYFEEEWEDEADGKGDRM